MAAKSPRTLKYKGALYARAPERITYSGATYQLKTARPALPNGLWVDRSMNSYMGLDTWFKATHGSYNLNHIKGSESMPSSMVFNIQYTPKLSSHSTSVGKAVKGYDKALTAMSEHHKKRTVEYEKELDARRVEISGDSFKLIKKFVVTNLTNLGLCKANKNKGVGGYYNKVIREGKGSCRLLPGEWRAFGKQLLDCKFRGLAAQEVKTINKIIDNTVPKTASLLRKTGEVFMVRQPKSLHKTAAMGDRPQHFVQYIDNGTSFAPVDGIKLAKTLAPGIYSIGISMQGLFFERKSMNTDSLLKFEDPIQKEILSELDSFWEQKERYEKKGFLHNRAILMFGPPGSGKSCITKLAIADLIAKGDVVFTCESIHDLQRGLKLFREVEPERRCLAIMEDVDELSEHSLLQLLDGGDAINHIMYLATTNYIDRLPQRVIRAGRFGRKIEVPHPPPAGRLAFLQSKLADENLTPEQLNDLVEKTDGFSFGHLREFVTAAFCIRQPIEEVLNRLRGSSLELAPELPRKRANDTVKYKGAMHRKAETAKCPKGK